MLPKKHKSGAQKRKERKENEQAAESQRGALHKFLPVSSNATVSQDQGQRNMLQKTLPMKRKSLPMICKI
jgi:hypothetical protein